MNYTSEYFDEYLERRGTRSSKWDGCNEKFGVDPSVEMLPMWIADMDFRVPEEVSSAMVERAKTMCYGYSTKPDSFYQAIIDWVQRRYHWEVKKEWIVFTPGVIPGFNVAYQNFTQKGDGIIVQTPVYYPFMDGVNNNGRTLVKNPLIEKNGYWTMDFELLEKQLKDPNNKILILSNPHNPVGRCWTKEELERVGKLCVENHVLIVDDEIHADLIMKGSSHCSMGTLSEDIKNNMIAQFAPSKTFNLAGLQTSYAIIPNEKIRQTFLGGINANRIFNMNWFGPVALETAYTQCESYVSALCEYVDANMDYMCSYIKENLPMLKMRKSEGTYMVWVDFRGTGMTTEEIEHFIAHKAHIGVDMGSWFGDGGEGYLRFNLACPRSLVEKAMKQLTEALKDN
jgi:cystathionine beta-lyase